MSDLLRTNTFKIIGTLKNAEIRTGNRASDGKGYISAKATVVSHIAGVDNTFDIQFFANQETADGKQNQLYISYSKLPDSIGRKVEISGDFRENRYWSSNREQMTSAQILNGRFVRVVADVNEDCATYELGGFVVEELKERVNKDNEIYRYDIAIGQANYNASSMSKFVLHVNPADREIINGVRNYKVGQTVSVNGQLNFLVEQITAVQNHEGGFGEGVTRTYTNTKRNYFIYGGSAPIVDVNNGMYPADIIRNLVAAYKANDADIAAKAKDNEADRAVEEAPVVSKRQTSLI